MRLPIVLFASAVLVAVSAIAGRISMSHAAAGPSYTAARDVGTFLTQQELASISSLQPSYEGAYPGIANNIHSGWAPAGWVFLQPYVEYKIARQRNGGKHFEAAKILWGHVDDENERKQVVAQRMRLIQNTDPPTLGLGGGKTWLFADPQSTFFRAKTEFYKRAGGRDAFANVLSYFDALYTGP